MANAFLTGLMSGRANKQNRLNEERRKAEEGRTATKFDNRQAGLADLQQEFGDRAFTAQDGAVLQSTVNNKAITEQNLERTDGLIDDEARAREVAATASGLDIFDSVMKKAIEAGEDPMVALTSTASNMTPQAQALFGFDDPSNVTSMINNAQANPNFFKDARDALIPPKAQTGSTAAPKTFSGTVQVTDADGNVSERRVELSRTADGQEQIVGGLPEGSTASNFVPDRPFAPQRAGSVIIQGTGGGQGIEQVGNVSGALQEGKRAEAQGTAVGRFEGEVITDDMQLSQTKSDQIGRMVISRRQGLDRVSSVIDDAISQTDWDSAGTIQGLKRIDGSTAANLSATLSTVQANATLDKLMEIKAAGATLGQITEKELALLRDSVSALEQSQSPQQLRANLEAYKAQLNRTVAAIETDYQNDIDRGRVRPRTGSTSTKTMSAADFLGGN